MNNLLRRAAAWLSDPSPTDLRPKEPSWLPLTACAVAALFTVIAVHWEFVTGERGFYFYDLINLYHPLAALFTDAVGHGELPLWNPHMMCGLPTHADPQVGLFYPPMLLHTVTSFPKAALALHILHLWWAAMGALALGRALGLGWGASLVCGLAYGLSGYFITQAVHPNLVFTAAHFPWFLAALRRHAATGCWLQVAAAAAAWALMLLSGGFQVALYGAMAAAVLAVYWCLRLPGNWKDRAVRLGGSAAAAVLGIGVAAVQLWPSWQAAGLSVRSGGVNMHMARTYGLGERHWLQLLVGHLYGLPGHSHYLRRENFWESYGYFGLIALTGGLTAVAMAAARTMRIALRWFRTKVLNHLSPTDTSTCRPPAALPSEVILFALLGIAAWWVGMGDKAPADLMKWMYRNVPVFDAFRAHGRMLMVVCLAGSVLGGIGVQELLSAPSASSARLARPVAATKAPSSTQFHGAHAWALAACLAAGACVALAAAARFAPESLPALDWVKGRALMGKAQKAAALAYHCGMVGACLVAAALLLSAGHAWKRISGRALVIGLAALSITDLVAVQKPVWEPFGPKKFDVARRNDEVAGLTRLPGVRDGRYRVLMDWPTGMRVQNLGVLHGYHAVRAYGPLMLRRTADLFGVSQWRRFFPTGRITDDTNRLWITHSYTHPALNLMAARYIVTLGRRPILARKGLRPLIRRGYWVYENPSALPLAYVAHHVRPLAGKDPTGQARGILAGPAFDPGRTALTDRPVALPPESGDAGKNSSIPIRYTAATSVRWSRGGRRLEVKVSTTRPGVLVASVAHYPGWTVRVDGRRRTLLRVNHAFMGVPIKSGSHKILFFYNPVSLKWGWAVTIIALLGLFAIAVLALLRRRRNEPAPG
jgi:hypothetical protein